MHLFEIEHSNHGFIFKEIYCFSKESQLRWVVKYSRFIRFMCYEYLLICIHFIVQTSVKLKPM